APALRHQSGRPARIRRETGGGGDRRGMTAGQVRRAGDVAEFVLSRPERLNAMNMAWVTGLVDAVAELERDKPGIVVVRGEGRAFCAGLDLDILAPQSMPA